MCIRDRYDYQINGTLTNADFISDAGLYIGNHPELTNNQIKQLTKKLNNV